jgi:gluconolactonase
MAFFVSLLCAVSLPAGIIEPGATLEKLGDGFAFTEGPAADRDGNVFFTDQPNDRIMRWDARTRQITEWMKPSGRSNGMMFDRAGNLIACADADNELWSISPDKKVTVLVKGHANQPLNGPNDLWIRPDGGIYFTDPLYKRPYWKRHPDMKQSGRHVYFWKAGDQDPRAVATDLTQPNGIIGTADGKTLYVADIDAKRTYRYDVREDGSLTGKRLFCEMGSDGMTIDERGNVYLTGRGVTVYNPQGEKIEQIDVPEGWTANVTFGGTNRRTLFITASGSVYGLSMAVRG